jgi:hypothetical protein
VPQPVIAPPVVEKQRDAVETPSIKRIRDLTEADLLKKLAEVPEIGLADKAELSRDLLRLAKQRMAANPEGRPAKTPAEEHYAQFRSPESLTTQKELWQGLGLAVDPETVGVTPEADAQRMADLGRYFRRLRIVSTPGRESRKLDSESLALILEKGAVASKASPLPTLVQMFQAEEPQLRLLLVEQLAKHDTPPATAALVGRVLFDAEPTVRVAAVEALRKRSKEEVRQLLVYGLRHPWPAAAEHAAEALVALKDRDARPALATLLAEPSFSAPFTPAGEKKPVVRELVRVNHLKNCLLCHEPSAGRREVLTGFVPVPGQALPPEYYAARPRKDDVFVRADVVYVRQDFSVTLPVADAKPWPERQRFDFVVRTRPATEEEIAAAAKMEGAAEDPQHQAIRFALKELDALGAAEAAAKAP